MSSQKGFRLPLLGASTTIIVVEMLRHVVGKLGKVIRLTAAIPLHHIFQTGDRVNMQDNLVHDV